MSQPQNIVININLGDVLKCTCGASSQRDGGLAGAGGLSDVLEEAHENAKDIYEQSRLGPQPCPPFLLMVRSSGGDVECNQTLGDPDYANLRTAAVDRLDDPDYKTGKAPAYQESGSTYHGPMVCVTGTGNAPYTVATSDSIAAILVGLAAESIRTSQL